MADYERDSLVDEMASGAVSGIPFVGGMLAPLAARLSGAVRDEWTRNASHALAAAEATSGMTREELATAIEGHPELVPLVTRVLFAAGMNGHDDLLRVLGGALGEAVREPVRVDEVELILVALEDLRPHHVVILRSISQPPPPPDDGEGAARWYASGLVTHTGYRQELVALCMAALTNGGLVSIVSTYGGDTYEVSELGTTVLQVLDRYPPD